MDKTKSFGLSLIGFSEIQTKTFSAILSLAERGLQDSWRIIDANYADFFILSTEKSESDLIINAQNLPRERCLFCTHQDLHFSEYNDDVLFISSGEVPQLSSVVKVLNHAAHVSFSEQVPADSLSITPLVEAQKVVTLGNNVFDPDRGFLKQLLQNTAERQVYRFGSPEGSYRLYVDLVKKIYYCETSLNDLSAYLIIKDVIVIDVISETEWENAVEQLALPAKSLANLIWYVTFKLSNGRLLRGHSDQDYIYLTRWPDLGVEGCGKYVKLAAFMCNNATCLTVVADKINTPLTEVYSFYNACYLIGIVEKTTIPELHTKSLDEDKQSLLEKITNRLQKINSHNEKDNLNG